MSGRLSKYEVRSAKRAVPGCSQLSSRVHPYKGVGMLEFLVALLIFSTGMMGLISSQVVGKKASFDAAQRSVATGLARDLLERMRANPGEVEIYLNTTIGNESDRFPSPIEDCNASVCSAAQLAEFDLWQWESLLLGDNEQDADGSVGGLVLPRACITGEGGHVTLAISWQGSATAAEVPRNACDDAGSATDDVAVEQGEAPMQRRKLAISTFIAGT